MYQPCDVAVKQLSITLQKTFSAHTFKFYFQCFLVDENNDCLIYCHSVFSLIPVFYKSAAKFIIYKLKNKLFGFRDKIVRIERLIQE